MCIRRGGQIATAQYPAIDRQTRTRHAGVQAATVPGSSAQLGREIPSFGGFSRVGAACGGGRRRPIARRTQLGLPLFRKAKGPLGSRPGATIATRGRSTPLRHPAAVPLVVWRHTVDPTDGLRVASDGESDARTHDGQRFPVDVVDGVAWALEVRIERHAGLAAP